MRLVFVVFAATAYPGLAHADESAACAARAAALTKRLGLPAECFTVDGRFAFTLLPEPSRRATPQPWVMYSPALPDYPDEHERWMHEQLVAAGVAVAGIDVGEAYGSPRGREAFSALYQELVERRGFAPKVCLLGRSRGGLWAASWAADNPEKVAGIAGIYPAFDLRTYPGLVKAAPAYKLTPDQLQSRLDELNPIARIAPLAAARVPALFIHGQDDAVVPLAPNSGEFAARYKAAGAGDSVTLIAVPGQGHNFWEGFFRCQPLVDFTIARAKAGAESAGPKTQ
jgi:dipeptidyl aminopeptidase/acylaminoacyl peptidase